MLDQEMNTCGIKYMLILFANARVQVKDKKKNTKRLPDTTIVNLWLIWDLPI